jgi:hypothetical protein
LHEFGHALGLAHASTSLPVQYANYNGIDNALNSDDIAGIRAIYGGRSPDRYDAAAANGSFASARNLTSAINPSSKTALVTGLDITTTSDTDYYKFTAPTGGSGTLTLRLQSSGLSLLAPVVRVYNEDQKLLRSVSGAGRYGTTLTVAVSVTAGEPYYVMVDGAESTALGTGAYALTVNFGTGASPTVPEPNTQSANGNPLNGGGGLANREGGLVDDLTVVLTDLVHGVSRLLFSDLQPAGEDHATHSELAGTALILVGALTQETGEPTTAEIAAAPVVELVQVIITPSTGAGSAILPAGFVTRPYTASGLLQQSDSAEPAQPSTDAQAEKRSAAPASATESSEEVPAPPPVDAAPDTTIEPDSTPCSQLDTTPRREACDAYFTEQSWTDGHDSAGAELSYRIPDDDAMVLELAAAVAGSMAVLAASRGSPAGDRAPRQQQLASARPVEDVAGMRRVSLRP